MVGNTLVPFSTTAKDVTPTVKCRIFQFHFQVSSRGLSQTARCVGSANHQLLADLVDCEIHPRKRNPMPCNRYRQSWWMSMKLPSQAPHCSRHVQSVMMALLMFTGRGHIQSSSFLLKTPSKIITILSGNFKPFTFGTTA